MVAEKAGLWRSEVGASEGRDDDWTRAGGARRDEMQRRDEAAGETIERALARESIGCADCERV